MCRLGLLALCAAASALALAACASPAAPAPVPVVDPPKITCPAPQSAQSPDGAATAVAFPAPTVANGRTPVTVTCTPAAGSAFAVGQNTVTCQATDALQRTDSCSFVVTVSAPPKVAITSFLAFGDSITYGEDGQNSIAPSVAIMSLRLHPSVQFPLMEQYPEELREDLLGRYRTQTFTVFNGGNPGESAGDPATFTRFVGLLDPHTYSAVLIMEGSNDIFYGDPTQEPNAIAGLRQMIRYAKGVGVRPYLATVPPMNPPACDPVCRGRDGAPLVPGLDDSIRSLAAAEGATLVDVYQGFGGNLALIGPDGLHPSADGYAKIANIFFTSIEQTLEVTSASGILTRRRATTHAP